MSRVLIFNSTFLVHLLILTYPYLGLNLTHFPCRYFLRAVKNVASFCTFFCRTIQTCIIVNSGCLSLENKYNLSEISQRLKTVISAIHFPIRRRFSHCHFRKFNVYVLNYQTSITNTRTLALSSNYKDKVSEKSHEVISPICYLLAALFLPLQTRDQMHLNDVRRSSSRRHCSADVHCAPL